MSVVADENSQLDPSSTPSATSVSSTCECSTVSESSMDASGDTGISHQKISTFGGSNETLAETFDAVTITWDTSKYSENREETEKKPGKMPQNSTSDVVDHSAHPTSQNSLETREKVTESEGLTEISALDETLSLRRTDLAATGDEMGNTSQLTENNILDKKIFAKTTETVGEEPSDLTKSTAEVSLASSSEEHSLDHVIHGELDHTATEQLCPLWSDSAEWTESPSSAHQEEAETQPVDQKSRKATLHELIENLKTNSIVPKSENFIENYPAEQLEMTLPFLERESSETPSELSGNFSPPSAQGRGYPKCGLCDEWVDKALRNLHVVTCHLKKPLYYCPYCSKFEYFNFNRLHEHITKVHPGNKLEVLSTEEMHKEKLNQLSMECFGKPVNNGAGRKRSVPVVQMEVGKVPTRKTESDLNQRLRKRKSSKFQVAGNSLQTECSSNEGTTVELLSPKSSRTSLSARLGSETCCQLCGSAVLSSSRHAHVVICHLKEPLFYCPYCDATDWVALSYLKRHISKAHPDKEMAVISTGDYFKERLAELRQICFGICVRPTRSTGRTPSQGVKVIQVTADEVSTRKKKPTESLTLTGGSMQWDSDVSDEILGPAPVWNDSAVPPPKKKRRSGSGRTSKLEKIVQGLANNQLANAGTRLRRRESKQNGCMPGENEYDSFLSADRTVAENTSTQIKQEEPEIADKFAYEPVRNFQAKAKMEQLEMSKDCGKNESDTKFACGVCGSKISSLWQRKRHVTVHHFGKPVFFCEYCSAGFSRKDMCLAHVKGRHSDQPMKYINKSEEYEKEIMELVRKCFGDSTDVDKCSSVAAEEKSTGFLRRLLSNGNSNSNESVTWNKSCRQWQKDSHLKMADKTKQDFSTEMKVPCQCCGVLVWKGESHKLGHILHHHMGRKVYFCSCCEYASKDKTNCCRHVASIHSDQPSCEVMDRTWEYLAEIQSWKSRCFGNVQRPQCKESSKRVKNEPEGDSLVAAASSNCSSTAWVEADKDSAVASADSHLGAQIEAREMQNLLFCAVCKKKGAPIRNCDMVEHICVHHVKKDIFFCLHCDYRNSGSEQLCRQHIKRTHPDENEESSFRSDLEKYKSEIESWAQLCFPGEENQFSKEYLPQLCTSEEKKISKESLRLWCRICQKSLKSDSEIDEHILLEHIKKAVYFCAYCDYCNHGSKLNCIFHVSEEHPEEELMFKCDLEQYRAELLSFKSICFNLETDSIPKNRTKLEHNAAPNLKPKFVVPRGPKICGLCGARDVTKALRHVLAHHLKKLVYFCGYCEHGTMCQPTNIRAHIQKKHPKQPIKIRDLTNTEPIRSEIEDLERQCYAPQTETAKLIHNGAAPGKNAWPISFILAEFARKCIIQWFPTYT